MDEDFAPNPFVGSWPRQEIPGACGRCHSDAERMRRFRPGLRVDQEQEYWTSRHGKALLEGNTRVAVCVDCHDAHGILAVRDPLSPVHPRRVAETCNRCQPSSSRCLVPGLSAGTRLP